MMNQKEQKQEQDKICKLLRICGYDVVDIEFYKDTVIENMLERLYKVKLRLFDDVVERIVFMHGMNCLDMLSKNVHIEDMFGKGDDIILPRSNGHEITLDTTYPWKKKDGLPKEILHFLDYSSLREHFFERGEFIQLVCGIRTDEFPSFDYGEFGRYKITVMTTLD